MWDQVASLVNDGFVSLLMKGGIMMIPLLASSVIALTVIAERFFFWRRLESDTVDSRTLALAEQGDFEAAHRVASRSSHPLARLLKAGLEHKHLSPSKAMEVVAQREVDQIKRLLPILDTIITLAPLLGLLGTITGMIGAFGIMSDAGLGQPHAVTGGVAEALVATATGLFVAIMALVPYNYFNTKVEHFMSRVEERATYLELLLSERKE